VSRQESATLLQTIDEFFDFLAAEFRPGELIVCFDEFQSVLAYPESPELLARIRGKIQYHKFPYVFTGSDRTGIKKIFTDPRSPFFESVRPMEVPALARADFEPFLAGKFAGGCLRISSCTETITSHGFEEIQRVIAGGHLAVDAVAFAHR
jgi:hypothetical protein